MMTSSQECTDHHRVSSDVNNKGSFTNVNNNPSTPSVVDYAQSSPMMRASFSAITDQSAAIVGIRRSDAFDYRADSRGSGSGSAMAPGIAPSFRSPKLESRVASGGGASAKKAQKTSHHSSTSSSATGKWRQKTTDVGALAAGGRLQASDSVRKYLSTLITGSVRQMDCSRFLDTYYQFATLSLLALGDSHKIFRCTMFRYSGENNPMSDIDTDVYCCFALFFCTMYVC